MARYIDAEKLANIKFPIEADSDPTEYAVGWNDAVDAIIENEPTADVAEVKHGRLTQYDKYYLLDCCSICRQAKSPLTEWNYCPNCGAKMDLKEEGND